MPSPTLSIQATDLNRAHLVEVPEAPADASIGEIVRLLVRTLALTQRDADGQEIQYEARLEREGSEDQLLRPADRVGDVLQEGDRIRLQPSIDAGRGARA
jgi:hypothetical protein